MAYKICRFVLYALGALYILALALFAIGSFGLFGTEPDPLSSVFLIPLGLPWNHLIDGFAESLWPWLTATAPLVNLTIIW
ncbi:hypothetical protein, partial [Ruegeria faecimaris]